jgi:hypothetical protein
VKILFIGLSIYRKYIQRKEPKNTKKIQMVEEFRNKTEFFFKVLMSLLLIYLFNPRRTTDIVRLDYETRLLLCLFGFILVLTADWSSFFKDIPEEWKDFKISLGK